MRWRTTDVKFFVNVTVDVDAEDVDAAEWQVSNALVGAEDNDDYGIEGWDVESVYAPGERY